MQQYRKYPRTSHLPYSLGFTSDDKVLKSDAQFHGKKVIITEKMDGENTTMYCDHIHARSIDSKHHESRDWVKRFHSSFAHNIPQGMRVCGENLFAQHSIKYTNLESYFYGFSVWDGDFCLSWDDTQEWFSLLGIQSVPIIYSGYYDSCGEVYGRVMERLNLEEQEGFVMRLEDSFTYDDFGKSVAKFVREKHVTTDTHWRFAKVTPNRLKGSY